MTAPIVYADTRNPYTPPVSPYMCDADRRTVKGWPKPVGQLWVRLAERT